MNPEKPHLVAAVDDDPLQLDVITHSLPASEIGTLGCRTGLELRLLLSKVEPDCVLLDLVLEHEDGMELLSEIRAAHPELPVIIMTGRGGIDAAVRAMKAGAYDFLTKPLEPARLHVAVRNAIEHRKLHTRVNQLEEGAETGAEFEGMFGGSLEMRTVFRIIRNAAPTNANVLITGESGTGKELAARAIHARSLRANGPFVPVNVAAVPAELAESVMFGHKRGAFTGAVRDHVGSCELADKGTLFLDEIGEAGPELQAKLLRFLQTRQVQQLGGSRIRSVDVRLVAATHREPKEAVRSGRLREDFYYRLNVVPIELPPLRNRHSDVPMLAVRFLHRFNRVNRRSFEHVDPGAMEALCAYSWPGNVRELENVVERIVVMHRGSRLTPAMLPDEIRNSVRAGGAPPPRADEGIEPLEGMEERAIRDALSRCTGNVATAAKRLGIGVATMYRKIRRFGIER